MPFYLGPVGNLQALPYMARGATAALDFPGETHTLLSGARYRHQVGDPRRTYTMARQMLTHDEAAVVEALALGAYGPGPFALIDPWRRNMLTANQSTGTDAGADPAGFYAATGTLASSTTQAEVGARSLSWTVTASGQELRVSGSSSANADPAFDVPVLPSTAYVFKVRVRSLATVSVTARLYWFSTSGASLSSVTSSNVSSTSAGWATVTISGTSPAGAALARPAVRTASAASTTVFVDQAQLEAGSSASGWTPGTGVPRVVFEALGDSYPLVDRHDVDVTLVEVG